MSPLPQVPKPDLPPPHSSLILALSHPISNMSQRFYLLDVSFMCPFPPHLPFTALASSLLTWAIVFISFLVFLLPSDAFHSHSLVTRMVSIKWKPDHDTFLSTQLLQYNLTPFHGIHSSLCFGSCLPTSLTPLPWGPSPSTLAHLIHHVIWYITTFALAAPFAGNALYFLYPLGKCMLIIKNSAWVLPQWILPWTLSQSQPFTAQHHATSGMHFYSDPYDTVLSYFFMCLATSQTVRCCIFSNHHSVL